jgi:hypothetical protein
MDFVKATRENLYDVPWLRDSKISPARVNSGQRPAVVA